MTLGEALGAAIAAYRDKRNEDCAAALVRVVEIAREYEDVIASLRAQQAAA